MLHLMTYVLSNLLREALYIECSGGVGGVILIGTCNAIFMSTKGTVRLANFGVGWERDTCRKDKNSTHYMYDVHLHTRFNYNMVPERRYLGFL